MANEINTTEVAKRLGLTVTQKLLDKLGIGSVGKKNGGSLYQESDIPKICDALIAHLTKVKKDSLAKPQPINYDDLDL